ncbi:MAG: MarR family transcriptional regulator [Betaproteobacteria bacterium]|nr:MarR family transcriptional regulator [Betaproteobacteria bacterium]
MSTTPSKKGKQPEFNAAQESEFRALPFLVGQPGHLARRFHQIAVSIFCEEFARIDVTPVQYAILCAIHDQPGIDQVTLAGLVALDTSTSASVCARMEERGLVRRAQSGGDRRKKSLALTEAGRLLVRQSAECATRLNARVLAPLQIAEQETFMRLLERLVDMNNALSRAPYQAEAGAPHR